MSGNMVFCFCWNACFYLLVFLETGFLLGSSDCSGILCVDQVVLNLTEIHLGLKYVTLHPASWNAFYFLSHFVCWGRTT